MHHGGRPRIHAAAARNVEIRPRRAKASRPEDVIRRGMAARAYGEIHRGHRDVLEAAIPAPAETSDAAIRVSSGQLEATYTV